jgi:hypothetical protein
MCTKIRCDAKSWKFLETKQGLTRVVDDDEWLIEEDSEIALQLHKWLRYVSSSCFCLFFFPFIRNAVLSS